MKYTDLGDKGPDFIREMDSQGYRGSRDSVDDAGKKEYSGKVAKPGDVVKQGAKALDNAFNHKEDDWSADFERRMKKGVAEDSLNEFAPDDSGSEGEEDLLLKFAKMWYNGDEATQQQVEKALARQGWEIGELESEEGGAFVMRAGDEHGDSYIGFEANDLTEASLAQMRDYFNQADSDSVKVDRNYDAPRKKQNPLGVPPEIQALVNKMYHAGKISPQEFEVLRRFQQKTKINVGIREADKNPYAIGMAQAMKSTGDKPPLKKSTINKAHKIARAIEKGE
jgi:hypothetical protein